jgi:hypothetical protein
MAMKILGVVGILRKLVSEADRYVACLEREQTKIDGQTEMGAGTNPSQS